MRFRTKLIAGAALLFTVLASCRGLDKNGVEHNDLASEKAWYDANGTVQRCEVQPPTCKPSGDPNPFIDSCVKQGYQAKSCGCFVLCSAAIKGFRLTEDHQAKKPAESSDRCSESDRNDIEGVRTARKQGTSLDRCIAAHVCNGKLGLCAGVDLITSTRLRDVARRGCADTVLNALCQSGFQDTFSCPDQTVQTLSSTWTELKQEDDPIKRCIREVVCSDRSSGCDPTSLRRATEIKKAIDQPGCIYWLRGFCAVGTQSW
jgi:hypothetical protein